MFHLSAPRTVETKKQKPTQYIPLPVASGYLFKIAVFVAMLTYVGLGRMQVHVIPMEISVQQAVGSEVVTIM